MNVHSVGDHDHCCFYYLCKLKSGNIVIIKELNQEHIPEDMREIGRRAFEIFDGLE